LRQKYVYVPWFVLQFLLILSLSSRDTFRVVADGPTVLPRSFQNFSREAQALLSIALAQKLPPGNPVREAVSTYVHVAGIESGYGYFAPNVPGSYVLVFELHYPDGRIEYELPSVRRATAGLRIAGLVDSIGRTPYDALREILVKTLAQSAWRKHPDVESVRAILASVSLPGVREFQAGKRQSYEFLYAYDFSPGDEPSNPRKP
jgi:hypothetical protein